MHKNIHLIMYSYNQLRYDVTSGSLLNSTHAVVM